MPTIRPLLPGDNDDDWARVYELQCRVYPPEWHEDVPVLRQKATVGNGFCFLYQDQGELMGYCLAHPWASGQVPKLNAVVKEATAPVTTDNLFLHDLAVATPKQGIGKRLFQHLQQQQQQQQVQPNKGRIKSMSLVAVNGSHSFWTKLGFQRATPLDPECLQSYGSDAAFMVLSL
ncbi:Gcn5-related n-acetyltransferase [Seminavis robusta]|uniref:Gcn5-related n-acetyltransferase n=1 Tax=Seminavis robusta TaxID=568900 RepID=A0A9N8DSB8_9STRA|nr:Gcn5-related n-acetyltransferase [Seminavis robusta]|eukprot:Sro307_g113210.1 Gcn5-related n-acetyltransferase (175) ;mRNA; f:21848-22372